MNCKRLTISLTAILIFGVYTISRACDVVNIQSKNNTTGMATIGITMNATPADSLGVSLAAGGSQIDALPIGKGSAATLLLSANVSEGGMTATCQTSVINQNATTACSGVIDPKYVLSVQTTNTQTCTPNPTGGGGGKDDDDDDASCRHDNGNHWGERKKLGLPIGEGFEHLGKPNADCKQRKHGDRDNDDAQGDNDRQGQDKDDQDHSKSRSGKGGGQTCTTTSQLSCGFALVTAF